MAPVTSGGGNTPPGPGPRTLLKPQNLLKALKGDQPDPAQPGGTFEVEFADTSGSRAPVVEEVAAPIGGQLPPFLAAALSPESLVAEQFRILSARIRALDEREPLRCIGLVSSSPGEGKTMMSIGLALSLAREAGARVLLIEADLRRPSVEGYLGLPPVAGLGEWLTGSKETLTLRRMGSPGFSLLAAGREIVDRPELLRSQRMARLLALARERYTRVILDCAPLLPIADSVLLQDLVDGFLMVVRARHAGAEAIQRSLSHLKPGRVRGVVFNDHREILTAQYGYGYGYYQRYRGERGRKE